MKPIKIFLLLTACLLMNLLASSQNSLTTINQDSLVKIPYKDVVNCTKSFKELDGLKKAFAERGHQVTYLSKQSDYLEKALEKWKEIDSVNQLTIKTLEVKNKKTSELSDTYKKALKKQKTETIIISTTLPVVAIISFVLGFYLH